MSLATSLSREGGDANTSVSVAGVKIPTWTTPLILTVVVSVLVGGTSFLGHLCGLAVGYLCECSAFYPSRGSVC